jgi:hypothetical protein
MLNRNHPSFLILGTVFASFSSISMAATPPPPPAAQAEKIDPPLFPVLSYADTADLAFRAPVVVGVQIAKVTRLKGELAPDLSADHARFLVAANVQSLLRGKEGLAASITYVADVPLDSRGKPPILKKRRMIVFADRVVDRPQEIRLVSARAQIDWSPAAESRLRAILTEANAADAPPRITGVARAFHVPGAVPGESETQIFLTTHNGRPVSLSVLRRPGETPHWAVALAEIVDDAAGPPARDTLLWYRLACFLPRTLPDSAVADMDTDNAAAAAADYAVVLAGLGVCTRTL